MTRRVKPGSFGPRDAGGLCSRCAAVNTYLDCIPQGKVGGELQVPQPHARHGAGPVASCQPPLYAQAVIRVACSRSTTASVAGPVASCPACCALGYWTALFGEPSRAATSPGRAGVCCACRVGRSSAVGSFISGALRASPAHCHPAEHRVWWSSQLSEPMDRQQKALVPAPSRPSTLPWPVWCSRCCPPVATVSSMEMGREHKALSSSCYHPAQHPGCQTTSRLAGVVAHLWRP